MRERDDGRRCEDFGGDTRALCHRKWKSAAAPYRHCSHPIETPRPLAPTRELVVSLPQDGYSQPLPYVPPPIGFRQTQSIRRWGPTSIRDAQEPPGRSSPGIPSCARLGSVRCLAAPGCTAPEHWPAPGLTVQEELPPWYRS